MPANDPLGYEAIAAIPVLPDPYAQLPPAPPPIDPSQLYLPPVGQPEPLPPVDPALAEVGPVGTLPASLEEQAYLEATQPGVSAAGRAQGLAPLAAQGSQVAQTALPAVRQAQVAQDRLDRQEEVLRERQANVQAERERRDKQLKALQSRRVETEGILQARREEVQEATKADPLAGKRKALWANAIVSWATAYFGNDRGASPADTWARQQSLIEQAAAAQARKILATKQEAGAVEQDLQAIADREDEVVALTDLLVAEENERAAQELQTEQARSDSEAHKFAAQEMGRAAIQEAQARRAKALQDEEERLLKREERMAGIGLKRAQMSKIRAETRKALAPPPVTEEGRDPRAIIDPYTGAVIGRNVDKSETSLRKDREYLIKASHNNKLMAEYIQRVSRLKRVWKGPGENKIHDQEVADLMQLYTQIKGGVRLELFGQTSTEAQEAELEKIVVPPKGFLDVGGAQPAKVMQNYVRRSNSEMEMRLRAMGVEKTRDAQGIYLPDMPMARAEALMSLEEPVKTPESEVIDQAVDREVGYEEWGASMISAARRYAGQPPEAKEEVLSGLRAAVKEETNAKRKRVLNNVIAAIVQGTVPGTLAQMEKTTYTGERVDAPAPTVRDFSPQLPSTPSITPLDIDAELLRGFLGR